MENETETSSVSNEGPGSHFYLTDVAVERSDEAIDSDELVDSGAEGSPDVADLWVRDTEDLANGRCYPLVSVTPGKWEVKGAIKLPRRIREIRCEIHCTRRHVHYFVDIECAGAELPEPNFKKELGRNTELSDGNWSMVISFGFTAEWELGIPSGADGALAAHINACSCDACRPGLCYTGNAIEMLQSALQLTPSDHPSMTRCLLKLGAEHTRAFQESQDLSHLDSALSAISNALDLTARSDPEFPKHLGNLANILVMRFNFTRDISSLDEAISKLREVVEATPEEDPRLPCRQNTLGHLLELRFKKRGNLSDLSDSIDARTKASEARLAHHTHLGFLAKGLRHSLQAFVQRVDALVEDGKETPLERSTQEVDADSCGCDTLSLLCTLGRLLHLRFQRAGASSDINSAISFHRLSVRLADESHPGSERFLDNLGRSLQSRFEHEERLCDIEEAISVYQKSANAQHNPDCHGSKLQYGCCIMHRVGTCFMSKYTITGDRADLDEAICTFQRMVYVDPGDVQHPCVAVWLHSLARAFIVRFTLSRDPNDLSEAISIQESLVQQSRRDDRALGQRLFTLSRMLCTRFCEFGDLEDVDQAIALGRKTIERNPEDSAELPDFLEGLAISLTHRAQDRAAFTELKVLLGAESARQHTSISMHQQQAIEYLTEAIGLIRKAIELTPTGHWKVPGLFHNLAGCLHLRFENAHALQDIDEALAVQGKAVELACERDFRANGGAYKARLAELFLCRYSHTSNDTDREGMIDNYEGALASPPRTQEDRLVVAVRLARSCSKATQVIAAFDAAIDAATLMIGLDQTIVQRYFHIHVISQMPLEAAAVACDHGRPDKATEWLEQGRCLVWNQLNHLRTPLETVRAYDPELARDLADVSRRLEEAGSMRPLMNIYMSKAKKLSLDDKARAHTKISRQWEELLAKARALPGLNSFLKPLPCIALLESLPSSGNIVIITAHKSRCDAMALVANLGEPLHIPLPDLTISKAREYAAIMNKKLRAYGFRGQVGGKVMSNEGDEDAVGRGAGQYQGKDRNVLYVLKGLWIEVVKPILDALAIPKADDPSASTLHRMWWCPTGVLSFLPLHAAGVYSDVGPRSECVLDYVASSYTPSISSLLERVQNDRQVEEGVSGLFLTNQPNVRGQRPLAGTTKEVNSIHEIATRQEIRVLKVEGSALSTDDCLKYMEEYSSVHFACHGLQSNNEPLKSQLRLETGALELGAIMQKNLKYADFAFLSACETSTGQEKLDNEVVHLAAGMLAAGYRRVVGTMWEIRDSHAVDVANDFYGYLMDHREDGSGSRFDGSRSAHALHHAVRQLRARIDDAREVRGLPDELEKSLLLWIPYVHYGY